MNYLLNRTLVLVSICNILSKADTRIHKFHVLSAEFHCTIHKIYAMDTLCHIEEFLLLANFLNCLADKTLARNNFAQIYTIPNEHLIQLAAHDAKIKTKSRLISVDEIT